MILQKDLIAESGLTRSTAETVLKRLRKRGEIEAVKDSYNHNRISYSDEDADKIRAEFAKVVERMNRHQESSPESREKEESKGKGFETPGSSPDKTVQDFVKARNEPRRKARRDRKSGFLCIKTRSSISEPVCFSLPG